MKKGNNNQPKTDEMGNMGNLEYITEGIAIHFDIKDFSARSEGIRPGMLMIICCINGRMQVDMNASCITVNANEIIICPPNGILDNFMFSPDYEGIALCLYPEIVMECLSENEIWDRFSHLSQSPVIRVCEESMAIINLCGQIVETKKTMVKNTFYREIILSTIKVALLESLGNLVDFTPTHGSGLLMQKDVLFKRFIELLISCKVKPRSLTWYADKLCVTPKYLSTMCKKVSGKSAFEWINEYVQIDIKHLLKNSNKSIKEISEYLEFKSISFFGKYCRQHFGVSPTEYRKQLRKAPATAD